jgi:hypothetical protein
MMMIMSIVRDYASELQPPTGPLFLSQVIYERREQWRNDIDRTLLIRPPKLCGSPTSSHLVANQEELGEENYEFSLRSIFVHTSKWFLNALKSYDMGPTALLLLRRKVCCGLLSPLPGLNPRIFFPMTSTLTIYTTEAIVYSFTFLAYVELWHTILPLSFSFSDIEVVWTLQCTIGLFWKVLTVHFKTL